MAEQIGAYDDEAAYWPTRADEEKAGIHADVSQLTEEDRKVLSQGGLVQGRDAKWWGVGMRFNTGKPPVWKGFVNYFPRAMERVAFVSEFGAKKYAWDNWQSIDNWENNIRDSLARHLVNQGKGQLLDKETGLLEAAHLAWNAMAYLEKLAQELEGSE